MSTKEGAESVRPVHSSATTSEIVSQCEYSDDEMFATSQQNDTLLESPSHFIQKGMESIGKQEIEKSSSSILSADDFRKYQPELTFHNRQIVVEWMYRVSKKISLPSEVLYGSIALLDRVFTSFKVLKEDVQLTAITCLWIQNKLDERHRHHKLALYAAVCQNAFQPIDFEKKEIEIVSFFGGQVEFQTAFNIIKIILDEINQTQMIRFVQFYYDVSLLSFRFNEVSVAATAVITILCALQDICPLKSLCEKCNFVEADIMQEAILLNKVSQTVVQGKECGIYAEYCTRDTAILDNLTKGAEYFKAFAKPEDQ